MASTLWIPAIGIDWPADVEPVLLPKDAVAPSLTEARRNGLLPQYADCTAYIARLRERQAWQTL